MSTYISSQANRFYVGLESSYGSAASVADARRFPAVRLHTHQSLQPGRRYDKTGTRTFLGISSYSRHLTAFGVQTYLTSWAGSAEPSYGPLFHAACGATPDASGSQLIAAQMSSLEFQTAGPHGFRIGSAVGFAGEIRFVTGVLDTQTFLINAPFRSAPPAGSTLSRAITYRLASALPSVTIFDYWDPATAVSRLITGAAVESLMLSVNGDFHEFAFSGPACDLLDSSSFASGAAGLSGFPVEPALANFDYSIVPGHLGEVWLGGPANQFFTLTEASVELKNNLDLRVREFGSSYPRAISAGQREVIAHLAVLAQDDSQTTALYQAAKVRTPVAAMLQLGQQQGQLMGVYLPAMTPEIPVFNDSKPRLEWEFHNNLAQGNSDDEIFIAFA